MHVEHGVNAAEAILARSVLIVGKSGGQRRLIFMCAERLDRFALIHFVHAKGSRFQRFPVQQANQPTRRYGPELRSRLGYICKLKCGLFTKGSAENFFGHGRTPFRSTTSKV